MRGRRAPAALVEAPAAAVGRRCASARAALAVERPATAVPGKPAVVPERSARRGDAARRAVRRVREVASALADAAAAAIDRRRAAAAAHGSTASVAVDAARVAEVLARLRLAGRAVGGWAATATEATAAAEGWGRAGAALDGLTAAITVPSAGVAARRAGLRAAHLAHGREHGSVIGGIGEREDVVVPDAAAGSEDDEEASRGHERGHRVARATACHHRPQGWSATHDGNVEEVNGCPLLGGWSWMFPPERFPSPS